MVFFFSRFGFVCVGRGGIFLGSVLVGCRLEGGSFREFRGYLFCCSVLSCISLGDRWIYISFGVWGFS